MLPIQFSNSPIALVRDRLRALRAESVQSTPANRCEGAERRKARFRIPPQLCLRRPRASSSATGAHRQQACETRCAARRLSALHAAFFGLGAVLPGAERVFTR